MGFDTVMASRALHLVKGDVQKALDELIQKGGIIPPSPDDSSGEKLSLLSVIKQIALQKFLTCRKY